jgi:hypothetical protein
LPPYDMDKLQPLLPWSVADVIVRGSIDERLLPA